MSAAAVDHVRRALAARQFDGHDPKDLSDDVEMESGSLPQAMMVTDAPLLYWVGFTDAAYATQARRRYVADGNIRVTLTAPRVGGERSSAVASRVEKWFVGAIAAAPVGRDGIIQIQPASVGLVGETRTDRAGRAVIDASVAVRYSVRY